MKNTRGIWKSINLSQNEFVCMGMAPPEWSSNFVFLFPSYSSFVIQLYTICSTLHVVHAYISTTGMHNWTHTIHARSTYGLSIYYNSRCISDAIDNQVPHRRLLLPVNFTIEEVDVLYLVQSFFPVPIHGLNCGQRSCLPLNITLPI